MAIPRKGARSLAGLNVSLNMASTVFSGMRNSKNRKSRAVFFFFVSQLFAITLLQKFAVNAQFDAFGQTFGIGRVEIALPLLYAGLLALMFFARVRIDLQRLAVFIVFLFIAAIGVLSIHTPYSINSVMLMIAIYAPFILYVRVDRATYIKLISIYCTVMLIFSFVVLAQNLTQVIFTASAWPNLDKIFAQDFLFQGYAYLQPVVYSTHVGQLMKPNAIFFLEVSLLSQWTAIAFALELLYFQRLWRLTFYMFTLITCFAGTGLLLLALSLPFLLLRLSRRAVVAFSAVIIMGIFVSAQVHWMDKVQHRFGEYQVTGRSANHRFVEPLDVMLKLAQDPNSVFQGEGPGSGQKTNSAMWWASTKVAYEYGFAAAAAFMFFMSTFLFRKPNSLRFAFLLFVFFNLMYGFIIPAYSILLLLLGGFFRNIERFEPSPLQAPIFKKMRAQFLRSGAGVTAPVRPRGRHGGA